MAESNNYQSALERSRRAKEQAEPLLDNKSSELANVNENLQKQNQLLEKRNQELELFASIVRIAGKYVGEAQILQHYIDNVCKTYQWPIGHIFVLEDSGSERHLTSSQVWHLQDINKFMSFYSVTNQLTFTKGEGLPGLTWQSGKCIWVDDIFNKINCPNRAELGHSFGLSAGFGVPIYRYNKLLAVAEFFSSEPRSKNDESLSIVEMVSSQLSTILERHYSESQLQDNYDKLQQMYDELKSTQSKLIQTSKLASIGQMAAGVAHEINNPLAFVAGNTSVFKKYIAHLQTLFKMYQQLSGCGEGDHKAIQQCKQEIQAFEKMHNIDFILEDLETLTNDSIEGLDRVSSIVAGLKDFARVDEAATQEADVNACINSAIKLVWNELKYKCKLKKSLAELPLIHCHPGQLCQVFMNLLVNAGQAITEQGEIKVSTNNTEQDIIITISDTGSGISEEHLSKLFDPFFTTKPIGSGTGLGLSICFGIIEKHHGTIDVETKLGEGTTFQIKLPLV